MSYDDLRENTPCLFQDGLSQEEFEKVALFHANKIRRVVYAEVNNSTVFCTVESQQGISTWDFLLDFNNWGHVNGTFWIDSENWDSSIPSIVGNAISEEIQLLLSERGIRLYDLSHYVDDWSRTNQTIGTQIIDPNYLLNKAKDKLLGSKRTLRTIYGSEEMKGKHLYPIFAMLGIIGFKNIDVMPVKDVGMDSDAYLYEVECVEINGQTSFRKGQVFDYDSQIIITYHEKKEITIPFPVITLLGKNYVEAGDILMDLGFSTIYESKIKDIVLGAVIKDGATAKIVIGDEEEPLRSRKKYIYDTPIIIYYHTYIF